MHINNTLSTDEDCFLLCVKVAKYSARARSNRRELTNFHSRLKSTVIQTRTHVSLEWNIFSDSKLS